MGSPNRAMRRRQQHAEPAGPVPTAGAVDLDKLKGGNVVKQRQALRQVLSDHGFICSCGARFEDEGIIAIGQYMGVLEEAETRATPMGELPTGRVLRRDGAALTMGAYHSKTCPDYLAVLKDGMPRGEGEPPATVLAVRSMPVTEWLGEVPLASETA